MQPLHPAAGSPPHPLVTVYVTNHNYGAYIQRAIDSVLAQTLDAFELIIIDDGSADNSREIIEGYRGEPRVTIIYQQNRGLNVTNNIALRASKGTYIMRLDADDYLDEHALAVMSGVLERQPELGLVFPDYYLVDEGGRVTDVVRRHDFSEVTLLDQPAHGACTMIRKSCLLDLGGYDEAFRCQDGYDLWVRFIRQYQVQNINLPLFYYRQHGHSLTRDEGTILQTRSRILRKQADQHGQGLRVVAVVPVRGPVIDPRSIVLLKLGGRPVLDWSLEAALGAVRLADVILTTPDRTVASHVAGRYGERVITIHRDARLAGFNTRVEETVINALEVYEEAGHSPADAVLVLYTESPFRSSRNLDSAIDVMELFATDTVVGVRPELDVMYQHDGRSLKTVRNSVILRLEREELYREVGQLHLVRREYLERTRSIVGGTVGHVVLHQQEAFRIRTEWDWKVAELLAGRPISSVEREDRHEAGTHSF
ncbi:MAG: glycosyltransferase [Deltaproteobacteria bacterium]|nr:glycosyltransferase [Candidatus Anaeroferrophillacea bacterium]